MIFRQAWNAILSTVLCPILIFCVLIRLVIFDLILTSSIFTSFWWLFFCIFLCIFDLFLSVFKCFERNFNFSTSHQLSCFYVASSSDRMITKEDERQPAKKATHSFVVPEVYQWHPTAIENPIPSLCSKKPGPCWRTFWTKSLVCIFLYQLLCLIRLFRNSTSWHAQRNKIIIE